MTQFERVFSKMTKPWVVCICVVFIGFSYCCIDRNVAEHIREFHLQQEWPWLNQFTHLGLGVIYVGLLVIAALVCRLFFHDRRWEIRIWFLWLCVAVPSLVALILKILLGRARPELFFSDHLYGFFGPHIKALFLSFPSGHTTTIMGLMFGLSALFPRYTLGLIVLGILIASSRLLLVQHYVSDVFTAAYLALIEVGVLYYWVKPRWFEKSVY